MLVGDGATRWVGTPGNARGREALAAALATAGFAVETQRAMSCTYHGMCAPVVNVVARLAGKEPELPGVLLSAHLDSVPVSPGAADDGIGAAAIVETARALAAGDKPRRTVAVVLADGEEAGLLGMDAFLRGHALADRVGTTINVDARGTGGPSFMFETSEGSAGLVAMMASHLDRPVTTSLFQEVYRRMPNDTDFSLSKKKARGLNFGNTSGIENYHTPLDTLDAVDLGTLQSHGDHVLGMTRAFADADVGTRSDARDEAVWFDVLAFGLVRWPVDWTLPLAIGAFLLVVLQIFRSRAADRGVAAPLALVAGAAVAAAAGWALKVSGATSALWVAEPLGALGALHAAGALGALALLFALARRSTPRALWAGTWGAFSVLGIVVGALVPGASYLFIVPSLAAGVAAALPLGFACAVPAVVTAVLFLALSPILYDTLGLALAPLLVLPTIVLALALAPMLAGLPQRVVKSALGGLAALYLVGFVLALTSPKFTKSSPQRVNVVYRQFEGAARVFVEAAWGPAAWGPPPPAILAAAGAGGGAAVEASVPWRGAAPFAEVPSLGLAEPTADATPLDTNGGARRVRLVVKSPRGAPTIALAFPGARRVAVKVAGQDAFPRLLGASTLLGLLAVPKEGMVVELTAPGPEPIPLTILDASYGVPPGTKAEDAVRARTQAENAVPVQDGDLTVVTRRVSL